jgi:signal transduction histidine kinase/ligand-binding sensor domain-containing protein
MTRTRHAASSRAAVCLAILLAWCGRAWALNAALDITQYAHTAWTIREGFFNAALTSIAQTPDGYLWLGTESGLLRFDGIRAVPWRAQAGEHLPSNHILKLLASRDGRLWIGTTAGLASWKDGRLLTYPELAGHTVAALLEDSQGTVWVGTIAIPNARLCAIRSAVECVGNDGRLGVGVLSLFEDRRSLWVGATTGLWRWTPGNPTRFAMPTPNVNDLTRTDDGRLLIAMGGGIWRLAGDKPEAVPIGGVDRSFDAARLLFDRQRALWVGTSARGLVHVREGRADLFTRSEGLSGDAIRALYEDREGNVWVATTEGLDRFREFAVTTVSARQGLPNDSPFAVLSARDGSAWIATSDGLAREQGGRTTTYRTRDGLPDDHIGTLFEDSAGRILVATLHGIAAFDRGRFVPLRSAATRVVYGIAEVGQGDYWIDDQERGLIHLLGDDVVQQIPWSALGRDDHGTALVVDRTRARLGIGFYKGGVAFLKDGAIRASYGVADGLGAGRVSQLQFDQDGSLWAATQGGLSRIDVEGGRIATLTSGNGLPCDTVHWMIADAENSLWVATACGLILISAAEITSWITDPAHVVKSMVFNSSDGVTIPPIAIGVNPPVARRADGRLWFATVGGLGVVDPHHLAVNTVRAPVHIEQIVADRRTYREASDTSPVVDLPPLIHDLQIDYAALTLVAPEKVRFRYKLEGADRDWQDAGNRRQAFYTDLGPGRYRFRVAAANNSGVWNEAGAAIDLAIAPAYYQTNWFRALSVSIVLVLVWSAHRVRLRIVETHGREIRALNERLMNAQEQERIRIAGELHDGVMQQMLAVTMMLGTAKRRVAGNSEVQATLDKIQEKLIEAGTDIRQLSHDLHPPVLQEAGLPNAVEAYCEQFSGTCGIPIVCDADEDVSDLSPGAALALFRILQEALGNAAKYAHARRIAVRLTRSGGAVSLIVSDEGAGFDPTRLATSGGLGLVMMRERASQLNGTFDFESRPGGGTTIRVVIPFR